MSEAEVEKKEIPIEWKGRKETVVIRRLSIGEWNDITEATTKNRAVGTVQQVDFKPLKFQEMAVQKSIVKAPFKFDSVEDIRSLFDMKMFRMLYEKIEKFNGLTEEKKAG